MAESETAVLGGGCFWCLEAVYLQMHGVLSVESGYMGGKTPEPTYHDVCSGATGHVEVVQVSFDPSVASYRDILEVFFTIHDPTTRDRQGNDAGTQYRSVIFYHSPAQEGDARASRDAAQSRFPRPIVTQIVPAGEFWRAEEYHQQYLEKRGVDHCRI